MLVSMRPILEAADKYGYGQGGFNVNAVHQVKAAIEVHEMFRSPVILQGADPANGFMGGRIDFLNSTIEDKRIGAKNFGAAVQKYGADSPIPVTLHLDHGRSLESCIAAIDGGYTSVMIDGSSLPFEENMEVTREVVKYAHERGVSVEGELGVLAGVEDHVFSASSTYTNPLDAIKFIKNTKVDALAISYGTCHGANKGKDAKLRMEIAIATKECLRHEGIFCGLVSHGSSTVPQYIVKELLALGSELKNTYGIEIGQLKQAIKSGISKINVDTDIRLACTRNLKELFRDRPELRTSEFVGGVYERMEAKKSAFDPRAFVEPIYDTIMHGNVPNEDVAAVVDCLERGLKEVVGTLIVEFGSVGKAPLVEMVTLDEMAERYRKAGI